MSHIWQWFADNWTGVFIGGLLGAFAGYTIGRGIGTVFGL